MTQSTGRGLNSSYRTTKVTNRSRSMRETSLTIEGGQGLISTARSLQKRKNRQAALKNNESLEIIPYKNGRGGIQRRELQNRVKKIFNQIIKKKKGIIKESIASLSDRLLNTSVNREVTNAGGFILGQQPVVAV